MYCTVPLTIMLNLLVVSGKKKLHFRRFSFYVEFFHWLLFLYTNDKMGTSVLIMNSREILCGHFENRNKRLGEKKEMMKRTLRKRKKRGEESSLKIKNSVVFLFIFFLTLFSI